jgi:cytidine deaminase
MSEPAQTDIEASLYTMASAAAQKAHAPYSKLLVGVALQTSDGRKYSGCNIENASYPEGWCAETTAISHMIMDGGGAIAQMAVYCPQMDKITPCGGCRQRISEFGSAKTLVHLCDENGVKETVTLGDLLPRAFDF